MIEQGNNKNTYKPQRDWIDIVINVIALSPIAIGVFVGGDTLVQKNHAFVTIFVFQLVYKHFSAFFDFGI